MQSTRYSDLPHDWNDSDEVRLSAPFLLATVDALISSERRLEIDSLGEDGPEALAAIEVGTEELTTLGINHDNHPIRQNEALNYYALRMTRLCQNSLSAFQSAVEHEDSKVCCIQARLARAAIFQQLAIHPLMVSRPLLCQVVSSLSRADKFLSMPSINLDHRANVAVRQRSLRCLEAALWQDSNQSCEEFTKAFAEISRRSLQVVFEKEQATEMGVRSLIKQVLERSESWPGKKGPSSFH